MSKPSQVESVFFAALERKNPRERAVFLESACNGDKELRRQVERLLNAHPKLGDFLKEPVVELLTEPDRAPDATEELSGLSDGKNAGMSRRKGLDLTRTEHEESSDDEDNSLEFLQPSTKPGSLGRIGHYEVLEVLGKGGFGEGHQSGERVNPVEVAQLLRQRRLPKSTVGPLAPLGVASDEPDRRQGSTERSLAAQKRACCWKRTA
jgi:hypothetical protein